MKIRASAAAPSAAPALRMCKSAIAIAVAAACGTTAMAADAPPAPAPAAAAGDQGLSEVVVTGSRIQRRDYESPSPIVTLNTDDLKNSTAEVSIEQALSKLPQFTPGSNQFNQAANVQATAASAPGIATVNLRGLGSNRTLVLLDGRRAQPADASLEIDLNTLPVAALDSVEVVTGGAASTYGADAMAGVINFKLKHRFEGVVFDAQYGQSFHNDDKNFQGSVLLGANVADNHGNVMFGATYSDRTPVYVQDRKWANAANTDPSSPGGAFLGFPGFNLIPYVPGSFTPASHFGFNIPSQAAVDSVFSGYPAGTVPNRGLSFHVGSQAVDSAPRRCTSTPRARQRGRRYST
jgi:iron complex outermembrane recepter protein